jgi:D-3-phosphoglycerate dehydrogenase
MNTPGGNVVTTAEHAIAMMLALSRNIPQGTMTLKRKNGKRKGFREEKYSTKTLGVIVSVKWVPS